MLLLKLNELIGHDVYEFCYDSNYPRHWNKNSLFIDSDDIVLLSPYFDQIFTNFHYYGSQKITNLEWQNIKCLCLLEKPEYHDFFHLIDN